ncbi:kinase-like domain-containing protein [Suillus clintonianus]|uniref:kinase-like domain-containing protein n=1 Tax=Suillus clintonianus TaxID=1904413 RepID=UPI001B86DF58|nr:kinase-like domain-containing protein [Suillus clintonianus]KAG2126926.1 kinase-like domain-containing protein [Suillus clintonianus]
MKNGFKALRLKLKAFSCRAIHDTKILSQWPEEPLDLPADQNGGFYSATLGKKLNSTYTIVRKLGWGQHSSVWLAKHEGEREQQYVAVKILTSHATQVQHQLSNELGLLQAVRDLARESSNPGRTHVVTLLDSFEVSSTQGRHLCLVHEAMGIFPKISSLGFPVPLVKVVAKQLLLALDFLHRECHVVHTDLKPDNILVKLDNVKTAIEIREEESRSVAPMHKVSSKPRHAILSRPLRVLSSDELLDSIQLSKLDVKLTDFGTAVSVNGFHPDIIQPFALRAPEVILGCEWGTSADIWNLGCLIFEFLTGHWLFVPRGGPTWTPEAYHLAHMPAMAGEEFDTTHFQTGKHLGKYFDDDGKLRIKVEEIQGLENVLESYKVVGDDELSMCTSFLRSMLRLKPSDRASAADLMQHEWLKV